jgi:D-alanyl-D-alanine carboxypeptidase
VITFRLLPAVIVLVGFATGVTTMPAVEASASPDGATSTGPLATTAVEVIGAGVPGVLLRVQEGRIVRTVTAGVTDLVTGSPMRADATFRAGSITKTFVATVVLQLVDEGRLALDRPVATWLPGLLADGGRITVRQLLNHTSGLFDYANDPVLIAGIVQDRVWDPLELVAIAESHPASFAPGSAWAYSNSGYIVAGLLVERVTRHPLASELRRRIFEPLDLGHTSLPTATGAMPGAFAHGYVATSFLPTPDGVPFDISGFNPSHAWASGALVSSAADLSRFYRALFGGELLSPRLLRQMKTTVAEDPTNQRGVGYGLGIERYPDPCGIDWGHGGTIFGYEAAAFWNERTGRTTVMATNMFPRPEAAEAPLSALLDAALCGPMRR